MLEEKTPVDQISTLSNSKDVFENNHLAVAQRMSEEEFAAAEKSLKRKLDLMLLGSVWLIFVLNYLDRVGLIESLDFKIY